MARAIKWTRELTITTVALTNAPIYLQKCSYTFAKRYFDCFVLLHFLPSSCLPAFLCPRLVGAVMSSTPSRLKHAHCRKKHYPSSTYLTHVWQRTAGHKAIGHTGRELDRRGWYTNRHVRLGCRWWKRRCGRCRAGCRGRWWAPSTGPTFTWRWQLRDKGDSGGREPSVCQTAQDEWGWTGSRTGFRAC